MKIVEINGTNYASTGNIAINIAKTARENGFEVFTCCKNSKKSKEYSYDNQIYIGYRFERVISEMLSYLTGCKDSYNYFGTKKFIKQLKQIKPDLIHLHIMHDTYINIPMFFKYLKEASIPVVWTFHDCYAITGQCVYFNSIKCDKWKTGCKNCPQLKRYPNSLIDRTKQLWNKKMKLFNGVDNLTIATPSIWMADLVKQSYLKDRNVEVINNGIDLDKFKPIESDFREKYNLQNKKLVLGVGYIWNKRKGIDDFIELSKRLDDSYKIILVGTNDEVDKRLPSNILSIHRTYNQEELIKIYSTADVFVNPTYEDNFPTVNLEALACGAPVVTYKTGGSPESINDKCGSIVEKGDIDNLQKQIEFICTKKPCSKLDCITQARNYDMNDKYLEYIKLFKSLI